MDTTKILVVANAPGILQRVEETLAGLELRTAIRLRDGAAVIREGGFNLLVLYLGYEPQSTVELVATLAAEPRERPPAVVCLAPENAEGQLPELEDQMRAAGAIEFIRLGDYPRTMSGNEVLRRRILSAAARSMRATPVVRVLQRAAHVAGGTRRLADHLEVSERDLLRWMRGDGDAPEAVFLAAFELVLTDLERHGRKPS